MQSKPRINQTPVKIVPVWRETVSEAISEKCEFLLELPQVRTHGGFVLPSPYRSTKTRLVPPLGMKAGAGTDDAFRTAPSWAVAATRLQ